LERGPSGGVLDLRLAASIVALVLIGPPCVAADGVQPPILVYHRFSPVAADGMTVTTATFQSNLRQFRKADYTVIPLRRFVDYLLGEAPAPPARSVVITADEGHRSIYTDMLPLVSGAGRAWGQSTGRSPPV
jgi:hypothetical protein